MWVCALALVTLVAYANSFRVPFILDDHRHIEGSAAIRPPVSLGGLLSTIRPIVTGSLAINHAIGELDVTSYHVFNLVLHMACGLLVFGFARSTLRLPVLAKRFAEHADGLALFAAAVFLVHPVQTESVTYIIQRAEILAAGALIASLWYASTLAQSMGRGRLPAAKFGGLIGIGIVGGLSKELFFVMPALFALYDWCFLSAGRLDALKAHWPLYAVLITIGLASLSWGLWVASGIDMGGFGVRGYGTDPISPWRYLSWQFGVLIYYLRVIAFPDRLCFDCGYMGPWPVVHSWLGEMILLPALILAGLAVTSWWLRSRFPLATFCVWGSAIVLAPTSSVVPFADTYYEHRLYLPIAFVALLVGAGAFELGHHATQRGWLINSVLRRGTVITSALLCAVLASLTFARNRVYQDPVGLHEDTIDKAPEQRRAQFTLGIAYQKRGDYELAIARYQDTIRLNPTVARGYVNLGNVYMRLRRHADAVQVFEAATRVEPWLSLAQGNLTGARRALRRTHEAIPAAERAVGSRPNHLASRMLLAGLYAEAGRSREALEQYAAAARINPSDPRLKRRVEELVRRIEP